MSDDKRPKRAAALPVRVPPRQRRRKKRKIDVNPEERTLSEILPTSASHVTTSGEPTNLEQCVDDTVTVVGHTRPQLNLHSGISAVSTAQGLSVDSTSLSQSLPASTSGYTESSLHTSESTCKYERKKCTWQQSCMRASR